MAEVNSKTALLDAIRMTGTFEGKTFSLLVTPAQATITYHAPSTIRNHKKLIPLSVDIHVYGTLKEYAK